MEQKAAVKLLHTLSKIITKKAMIDFGTPEDTLIATLLSARTRDEQVLAVYPGLRQRFPTLHDLAKATTRQIAPLIRHVGFFQTKARAIKGLAQMLLEKHNGIVPRTMEELVELPGVGRKTASCVLSYAFHIPAIAVDTHVFRLAHRWQWANGKTPEEIEEKLKGLFLEKDWNEINRVCVLFGRTICLPGKPKCWQCPVRAQCPYEPKTPPPTKR